MFNISKSIVYRQRQILKISQASLSIFDFFKRKTDADVKKASELKQDISQTNDQPIQATQLKPKSTELKKEVRELERQGEDNLYGKFKRARKTVKERNNNLQVHLGEQLKTLPNVTIAKYESNSFKRGLVAEDGEHPFPISPRIAPYEIKDPLFGAKNYYWCSCGMSKSQPFCDSSHAGTAFKPIKFSLDQKLPVMHMCGCKLSQNAPFCDSKTCKMLAEGEQFEEIAVSQTVVASKQDESEPKL